MNDERRSEAGIATLLTVAMMALLALATMAAVGIAQVVAARHLAASAADLGALAGASAGPGDPCAAAATIVRSNDAVPVSCRVVGGDVIVTAAARTEPLMGLVWQPDVTARAGPVR